MKLKINFFSHIKSIKNLIILSVIYLSFLFYIFGLSDIETIVYLVLPFIFIFVLPVLVIHLNYFLSSTTRMSYNIDINSLVVIDGQDKTIYKVTDIATIYIYATPNRFKDSATRSFPFEDYHYAKIKCKNGQEITLTSLHSQNLDKQILDCLSDVPIEKVFRLFPLVTK